MRQPLVVGNWKMNGSSIDNAERLQLIKKQLASCSGVQAAICPPSIYLPQAIQLLERSADCGGQDVSEHSDGAYTGELSAPMLADIGCKFVIVGHSERREYHHETSLQVAGKAAAALQAGLTPIVCVGESQQQRESETTFAVIGEQLAAVKEKLAADKLAKIVIAYEPVWAIGTGLTATPDQAQEVHLFIREQLTTKTDTKSAAVIRILYGGSVKPDNAASLFSQPDIDGALVGGASLVADDFIAIVRAAAPGE